VSDFPIGSVNGVFDVTTWWLRHPWHTRSSAQDRRVWGSRGAAVSRREL